MSEAADDLRFVRAAISDARSELAPDALPVSVWAGFTLAGIALSYAIPALNSVYLWLLLIGASWAYTARRMLRRTTSVGAASFASRVLATIWFGAFTAATIVGFVGTFSGTLPPVALTPVHASIFGAASLASGAVLGMRWVLGIGLAWLGASAALFLVQPPLQLAAFGVAIGLLMLVPSLVVWRNTAR